MDYQKIRKVHVIYKTHLDIGFTDLAANVLERYVSQYIPRSVELARALNTDKEKKFIWTTGSYLIHYYLKYGPPSGVKQLEEALERGDICWHGIACTTHTELMSRELFRFDLDISRRLDTRFGRRTIAAKMTDVPGHTIGVVDEMYDAGLRFLHIGVNASSAVPMVPPVFVWRHGGKEIIVMYAGDYGAAGCAEGMDEVLEFIHTGDNLGPQSEAEILHETKRLRRLYPNAEITASTLDDYAKCLWERRDMLPVVEEEIGDTWIHGIASDPWKVSRYRTLLDKGNEWVAQGRLVKDSLAYEEFMMNLMLVAEHTWGLDVKSHLGDFCRWSKEAFQSARKRDRVVSDSLDRSTDCSYRFYESSHLEQREYLNKAVKALPPDLFREAEEALNALTPSREVPSTPARRILPGSAVTIGDWTLKLNGNGAIYSLRKQGVEWVTGGELGGLTYQTFSASDCINHYYFYGRDFRQNRSWSEPDFSKPGLEDIEDLEDKCYNFYAVSITVEENRVAVLLAGDTAASKTYGCPRSAQIVYEFTEDMLRCTLKWFDKDANRMPEALWFHFCFDVENPSRWKMRKLGQMISPLDVVKGGNRRQHCVEALHYKGADGQIMLRTLHAPLVSIGARNLYSVGWDMDDLRDGFYFNLFNNRWGTNFSMWCEDDCQFVFTVAIDNYVRASVDL